MALYDLKETDLDIYLAQFERLYEDYELPAKDWVRALAVSLRGGWSTIYVHAASERSNTWLL